ncbi:DUF523 domain-containing protein [Caldicoprobacter faecalis]|uniref:Uncharacterized conserved protein YbbK, DUF523 family n=1 Tax=Caldicoprobacter faecalis TaxID=937334 RepID=A0A1I5S819_9FIRM|nr:DUF523 domain-containing protein [Caldicoprobacter faecalis]SFP66841.1 Uncharacterized conserved protein YbbK, DUF523 family [Caldicoprobacter faecalis]
MILVSACLAGICCKYNGGNNGIPLIKELVKQGKAILLCPEQLGGLPTPRLPAEIKGGSARDVLQGKASVVREDGADVTENFIRGAREVLKFCQEMGIRRAILKSKSPSCGKGLVYDGTFTGKLVEGNGVTAQLLIDDGIEVMTEEEFKKIC